MSTLNKIKYPYDPTGEAVTNLITGEEHSVPRVRNRAFALDAGPFYKKSVKIVSVESGKELDKDDYKVLFLYEQATKRTGMAVNAVIYITNPDIDGLLLVDYQVVGGEFASNVSAIQQLLQSLEIDNRSIVFDDLIDLPVTFPPAPHLHHVNDLYGLEALIDAIGEIRDALDSTDQDWYQIVLDRLDEIMAEVNQVINIVNSFPGLLDDLRALVLRLNEEQTQRHNQQSERMDGIDQHIADIEQNFTEQMDSLSEVVAQLTQDVNQKFTDLTERVATNEQNITTINNLIETIQTEITNVKNRISQNESAISSLLQRMDVAESKITEILARLNYRLVEEPINLIIGRRYILRTEEMTTLPKLDTVATGEFIVLSAWQGSSTTEALVPKFQVKDRDNELLNYQGTVDVEAEIRSKHQITVYKLNNNTWGVMK